MERGVLYVATEQELVDEAQIAAESVREVMNQIPIAIATSEQLHPEGFDEVINLTSPAYGFKDKILGMEKTPFEKTLYLDTDTYMNDGVSELFELLEEFDIAAAHNANRDLYTNITLGVPPSFPEYNSGVVAFTNPPSSTFFDTWVENFSETHKGDQPSFRKTLYSDDARIATLPREYNYMPRYPEHLVKPIKILHGRILDIQTEGANKNFDITRLTHRMSQERGHQLYTVGGFHTNTGIPLQHRIKRSLNERGVVGTAREALQNIINRE